MAFTSLATTHAAVGPPAISIPEKEQDEAVDTRRPSSAPAPSPSSSYSPAPVNSSLSLSLSPQPAAGPIESGFGVSESSIDDTNRDAIINSATTVGVGSAVGARQEQADERSDSGDSTALGTSVSVSGGRVLSEVDGGRAVDVAANDRRNAAAAAAAAAAVAAEVVATKAAAGVAAGEADASRLRSKFAGDRLLRCLSPPSGVPVAFSGSSNGMGRVYGNTSSRGMDAPFVRSASGNAFKEDGRRMHQVGNAGRAG